MALFTISGREIEIKAGDYLYDNNSCVMFFSGDKRKLYRDRKKPYDKNDYVTLTQKVFKKGKAFANIPKDRDKWDNNLTTSSVSHKTFTFTQEWIDKNELHLKLCLNDIPL
jgi:hypothetical protein